MKKVCIVDGARIPFTRSGTQYLKESNKDLMTAALKALAEKLSLNDKEAST